MRQVFASQRLENVEAVAQLLREAGIEVRIEHGPGWRGAIRGNFSYRDSTTATPRPSVWVVRSNDQAQARQLLRDAGLWQSDSLPDNSFTPRTMHGGTPASAQQAPRSGRRIRPGLVVLIAVVAIAAWQFFHSAAQRGQAAVDAASHASAAAATPAAQVNTNPLVETRTHIIATPPALARMLVLRALGAETSRPACLSIDDSDPEPSHLQDMRQQYPNLQAASTCTTNTGSTLHIHVREYRTDGSGAGTVVLDMRTGASGPPRSQTLSVERTGQHWRVVERN